MKNPVLKGEIEVWFSSHAVFRADERGVSFEMLEDAVMTGKFEDFGNECIKISKRFDKGELVCVGAWASRNKIHVKTVVWRMLK